MSGERLSADVVLIGAGVIGCASALALRDAGVDVLVLDQRFPGAEASSAAAGILGAQAEAVEPGPFFELARQSLALYPALAQRLRDLTGVDVELRTSGVTALASELSSQHPLREQARWQSARGLEVRELGAGDIAALEPHLAATSYGVYFPRDARIDPPSLVAALHTAAREAGARFRSEATARSIHAAGDRVRAVELDDGTEVHCASVVVTAGSWSALIGGVPSEALTVQPARGQMVELRTSVPLLRSVVFGPACYLVPRDDGRVLVGSTLEFVGHQRDVTASAVRDLLDAATALVPDLARASFTRAWSGFRPHTPRGLPLLSSTAVRGVFLATGHHRNGILLAPMSAQIVRALVLDEPPPLDLAAFRVDAAASP